MQDKSLYKIIKGLSGHLSFVERLFIGLRLRMLPLAELDALLPRECKILEMGCGYGLLANYLSLASGGRRLMGTDISEKRISAAKKAADGNPNLLFGVSDMSAATGGEKYDAVVIIDSLHYFTPAMQRGILSGACRALNPGGMLIFRDIDADGTWKFAWNRLHERIMVGGSFTQTKAGETMLYFLPQEEYRRMLAELGFLGISVSRNNSLLPYTDTVFYGVKP